MKYVKRNKTEINTNVVKELLDDKSEFVVFPECFCFFQTGEIHSEKFDIYEMDGKIIINGYMVFGWVEYRRKCKICNHIMIFDMDMDDHFCPACNAWLYPICKDPECEICTNRPEKPLPEFGVNDATFPIRTKGGWEKLYTVQLDN